ncbi:MAG: alpha/beta hydrolase-fold protein [Sphingobacteriales bacterium JAD_PAG50586_3]|nr:MAG: alpha/beta hydrolase-fold protein [Sphingobacteriales bacterium JAD_PAG50586_3]
MKVLITSLLLIITIALQAQPIEISGYKQFEDLTLESANLGYKKFMRVYVPEGYDANSSKKYPLIIIFDRQNTINCTYQLQTIGYLTTFDQMPQSVIITIASHPNKRGAETTLKASNDNGLGEKNERFIMDELIPYANKNYHTNSFELLIGHSRYGYFTTYMLTKHMDVLNGVISISPFFKQTNVNLVDSMVNRLQKPINFKNNVYYTLATGDSVTDTQDYTLMKDALRAKMLPNYFKCTGYEFYNCGHMATPGLTVNNALYDTFSQWALGADKYYKDTMATPTEKVKYDKYLMGIIDYGDTLAFSLGTLNGKGWQYYNNKRPAKAIEAWQVALDNYPGYTELYLYMAQAALDLGKADDSKKYIQLYKDNIKKSTYYTKKDRKELNKELKGLQKK